MNQVGTQEVFGKTGIGTNLQGNAWAMHNSISMSYEEKVSFVLMPRSSSSISYVAAVTGVGGTDNLYTKIQNQGSTQYNFIGFYHGFNGGGVGSYGGFASITPIDGGFVEIYVTNAGDTMNVDVDVDHDGTVDYHYESSGITANVLGMGDRTGLGTYNDGNYDNWQAGPHFGVFSLSVAGLVAGGTAAISTTSGTAQGSVGLVYSLTGAGPSTASAGPCGRVTVDLSSPINLMGVFAADSVGDMNTSAAVPAGTTGVNVWMQALDLGTCTVSNGLAEVIG